MNKAFDHFWIGLYLIIVGLILFIFGWVEIFIPSSRTWLMWTLGISGAVCVLFGLWLILDDAWQHYRQRKHPEYRSPIHRFYGRYIYPIKWIQRLNRWADRKFGAK